MWIIRKDGTGVRELSTEERALVAGFSGGTLGHRESEFASRLLREIRSREQWLTCGCSKPAPIMNVALRDTGTLILRNNPGGPPHAQSCRLLKEDTTGAASAARERLISRVSQDKPLSLHAEFATAQGHAIASPHGGHRAPQRQVLLSLLLSIIEAAGVHEFDPSSPKSMTEQFSRIREAAARYKLATAVPLMGFFNTHISTRHVYDMAKKLKAADQFGSSRRYGLLMDVVDAVKGRTIHLSQADQLGFFAHAEKLGAAASGPWLTLATVATQQKSTSFYELGSVASIAIMGRNSLFPVLLEEERAAIKQICDLLQWMLKKHGRRVLLRRELLSEAQKLMLVGSRRVFELGLLPSLENGAGRDTEGLLQIEQDESMDVFKKRIVKALLA